MSEFRQNMITKDWVLISPNRSNRPHSSRKPAIMAGQPEVDLACVFCPGNEGKNHDAALLDSRLPNSGDWKIRVVKNKFSALEKTTLYRRSDFFQTKAGLGNHEVIITRSHNQPLAFQSAENIFNTFKLIAQRIEAYRQEDSTDFVIPFYNHGRDAGASIVHPHYQMLTCPFVPPKIHGELINAEHYYQEYSKCVYCEMVNLELSLSQRVVYENEDFCAISPFAAAQPFHLMILPKKHSARFENSNDDEFKKASYIVKDLLSKLFSQLNDPAFNMLIKTFPVIRDRRTSISPKSFHWHIEIIPRLAEFAGYELSTGININTVLPESVPGILNS